MPFALFLGGINMTMDVPYIARMIVINDIISEEKKIKTDKSYYNTDLDRECEYCLNTTAWD